MPTRQRSFILTAMFWASILAALGMLGWSLCRVFRLKADVVLDFNAAQSIWATDIGVLVFVAAIIERANEVIVMAFRDYEADRLEARLAAAPDADKPDAQDNLNKYKSQTKEFALLIALCFGLVASLAGVRAYHPLLKDPHTAVGRMFTALDVLLTAAMLAGGSEAIHRMANVVTSGADTLSTRIDKAGK